MEPLAYRIRPERFEDVVGQDHLVGPDGVLLAMLENKRILSYILYGPPGTGKTTIARIFAKKSGLDTYFFNASTDTKARLKDIIRTTTYHDILIVIDEIHRMNTDVQDYLLPYMENGKATIIGITALNPYQSVNIAIRSRCHLFRVKTLSDASLEKAIKRGLSALEVDIRIEKSALDAIIRYANHEVRSALNLLESAALILDDGALLTKDTLRRITGQAQHDLDADGDAFYNLLSGLQKSIRGSDVDAALFYLAQLLVLGDLQAIHRRLLVIAYEDIGLANPLMGGKVLHATQASLKVGMPEARIILGAIVIDMALSPKSNTAYLAIDKAIKTYEKGGTGVFPDHIDNKKIGLDPDIYHYPHDSANSINDQRYLPEAIEDEVFYIPKQESTYEKALAERLKTIDRIKHKKR
ncbi:MAG: replication-associated recombination protein A [Acholeplasmataceae bacterium]